MTAYDMKETEFCQTETEVLAIIPLNVSLLDHEEMKRALRHAFKTSCVSMDIN